MPLDRLTTLSDALQPLADKCERVTQRSCRICQRPFDALGFQSVCDACSQLPERKIAARTPRELGESWPERHRQTIADMRGPGLEKARELLPMALRGAMVVLAGDRGRGKTQIATWLAYQRGQAGKRPGIYAKAFDLFSDVKAAWGKQAVETEVRVMDRYKNAPFLVIDEAHERGETDWENRTLRNVLDHRYDADVPTVIIGNWPNLEAIAASLGASITDRITETGGVVWCKWDSYRAG